MSGLSAPPLPVQAATVAALVDNMGAASDDTLENISWTGMTAGVSTIDISASNTTLQNLFAAIERNLADLGAKQNAMRTALRDAGLMA